MKEKEYFKRLTEQDKIRIFFRKDRGKIKHFVVQYLSLRGGRWRSIVRVDTCHGYPHKHIFHANGQQYVTKMRGDLNLIFTESIEYIVDSYKKIMVNYLL